MNATDDDSPRLPKRSHLQAEAFGLSPRTPEWIKAERGGPRRSDPPVLPSADDTWVVAASRGDGWQLERFAVLLEQHAIEAELDRTAGLLRVRRPALRAASNLLRAHRRDLRRSKAATQQKIVDGVLLGMIGPPFVLATVLFVLVAVVRPGSPWDQEKLRYAAFVVLLLTVFFTARAVLVAARLLTNRKPRRDADPSPPDDADCRPAP